MSEKYNGRVLRRRRRSRRGWPPFRHSALGEDENERPATDSKWLLLLLDAAPEVGEGRLAAKEKLVRVSAAVAVGVDARRGRLPAQALGARGAGAARRALAAVHVGGIVHLLVGEAPGDLGGLVSWPPGE